MIQNKNKENLDHEFVKIDLDKKSIVKKTVVSKPAIRKKVEKISINKGEQKIKKELQEIYKNDDGSMPNMKDFKKKKKRGLARAFMTLLFACAFLAGVAWLGFFVFQPKVQFAENDVVLEIEGKENVMTGEEVKYRVKYNNIQNTSLKNVKLQIRYPEGFVFSNASVKPTNEKQDEWELSSLAGNANSYIDIFGQMYGSLDEKQSFRAFLNYTPDNFSSEFQKVANINIQTTESPVEINIKSPSEAVPGSEVEFLVETTNRNEIKKDNMFLVMEPAGGFVKTTSSLLSIPNEEYQWSLVSFGDKNSLSIKGSFNPEVGTEEAKVIFKVIGWKDADRQSDPYVYLTKEIPIKLLKTDLSLSLAINGSTNNITVEPGEVLNTSVVLKNAGSSLLKNFSVRLVYETPSYNDLSMLDWRSLTDKADGDIIGEQINPQTRRGIINWTSRQIGDLRQLDPNEELNIDLSIPLKDSNDVDLTKFIGTNAKVFVEVKYDTDSGQKLITSNEINMVINSDLKFEVRDQVKQDSQNKDVHTFTWLLSNSYHELKDIEISADIYGDISWQEENLVVPAGEAKWDGKEKKLNWKIGSMPTSLDVLALQFSFVLNSKNPSQTNLTSKVSVKAKDIITGEEILKSGNEVLLTQ
ncbi:MAG TPA: hypothetical protein DEB09_05590 [Candidatus Magasanikbacteria bacterium]|nr:hypothetical protein [Candidatus Magasanikbacteria bacterium]